MILEHFTVSRKAFRPASIEEYTVFQIARQLSAEPHLKEYLLAAERHPNTKLIKAYHAAVRKDGKQKAFFDFLNH